MSTSSCCKCGVPFDLSLEAPIVYIEKPYGKATCYDCMTCTAGCKMSLTKLQNDKIVWIWFDTEGVQCLPCIRKKQKNATDTPPPLDEPDNTIPSKDPIRTSTSSDTNQEGRWVKIGLIGGMVGVGVLIAVLLKWGLGSKLIISYLIFL